VKQNIFGGSLGGPVVQEKLGYFFVNYQGTRQVSGDSPGTIISTTIPPLSEAPGGRSQAALISQFFPSGLPAGVTGLDPVAVSLLNFQSNQFGGNTGGYLIPGGNPSTGAFAVSRPGHYNDDQFTTNWDHEFRRGADKLSARFFFADSEAFLPFGGGDLQESLGSTLASSIGSQALNFPFDTPVHSRFFNLTETHLFSPTLVNELRFGFVHISYDLNNVPPVTTSDLGIDRPTNNVTDSIYKLVFSSSGFEIGPAPFGNQSQTQDNPSLIDTLSWVHGAHVLRFGGEMTFVNLDKNFPQVFNGELFFTNTPNGLSDFQNFLIGSPQFSFGGGGLSNHQYHNNNFAVFVQDDWKATHNLTVNVGLRAEFFGAFYDGDCHIGNLDPSLAAKGQYPFVYPSCVQNLKLPGLSGNANNTTYNNNYSTGIGPRIGLAYDLFGHHNTTIRTGYGIYYVREDVGTVDQLSFQSPFLPVAFGGGSPGCLRLPVDVLLGKPTGQLLPHERNQQPQRATDRRNLGSELCALLVCFWRFRQFERQSHYGHHPGRELRSLHGRQLPRPAAIDRHLRPRGSPALRGAQHPAVELHRAALPWQGLGSGSRLCRHALGPSA
jgi:hypothetical protein